MSGLSVITRLRLQELSRTSLSESGGPVAPALHCLRLLEIAPSQHAVEARATLVRMISARFTFPFYLVFQTYTTPFISAKLLVTPQICYILVQMSSLTGTSISRTGDPFQHAKTSSLNQKSFPRRSLRDLLLEHRMIRSIACTADKNGRLHPSTTSHSIPRSEDKRDFQIASSSGAEEVSSKHFSAKGPGVGNDCS